MEADPEIKSLPIPQVRAITNVRQMFRDRYGPHSKQDLVFDRHHNMWELFSETARGEKVMAVFADCKIMGDVMELEEFNPQDVVDDDVTMQSGEKCKVNTNQNTGMDFVKLIVKFATTKKLHVVLIITDFMTPHAVKHMANVKGIDFTHFSYEEVGIEGMARHVMQPLVFRVLDEKERADYIRQNPRFRKELQQYSVTDALVKYYGMHINDIVYVEDNDRQTGLVVEYALIVENL